MELNREAIIKKVEAKQDLNYEESMYYFQEVVGLNKHDAQALSERKKSLYGKAIITDVT